MREQDLNVDGHRERTARDVHREKALGVMNPARETTMPPNTRRLARFAVDAKTKGNAIGAMNMLLSKKRVSDRRDRLQAKSNLADV